MDENPEKSEQEQPKTPKTAYNANFLDLIQLLDIPPAFRSEEDNSYSGESEYKQKTISIIQMDYGALKKQEKLYIEGVEVYFPYKPYQAQVTYMAQVIKSLNNRNHALLQSPTGTGKTLCLLCATLGWLKKKRYAQIQNREKQPIRIIYSSRTHSQIKQVVRELKKTAYRPGTIVMASRDQYCIKRDFEFLRGNVLISACMKACYNAELENPCRFFKGASQEKSDTFDMTRCLDIEEMRIDGGNSGYCPYYLSRRLKDVADIVFMPYNYLLDYGSFPSLQIDLAYSIIIFDEAHNVQKCSEEGASYQLSLNDLKYVEDEVTGLLNKIYNNMMRGTGGNSNANAKSKPSHQNKYKGKNSGNDEATIMTTSADCEAVLYPVRAIKQYLINTMQNLYEYQNQQRGGVFHDAELGHLYDCKDFLQVFLEYSRTKTSTNQAQANSKSNVYDLSTYNFKTDNGAYQKQQQQQQQQQQQNPHRFSEGLRLADLSEYLRKLSIMIEDLSSTKNYGLDAWQAFLSGYDMLYRDSYDNSNTSPGRQKLIEHYRYYFKVDPETSGCTMNLWCLDPSISFKRLMEKQIYNILLTSGTLEPFAPWESELRLDFGITLSNEHVIDTKKNLCASILKCGPQQRIFNFNFDNRENEDMYCDLGNSIILLCQKVPHGVLIIFSSYALMTKCRNIWVSNTAYKIWERLNDLKPIIMEPKSANDLQETMFYYATACKTKKGGILMAVCRGKISEGIDFSDELARAVFIVGVPYPPYLDKRVKCKQTYLDLYSHRASVAFATRIVVPGEYYPAIAPRKLTGYDWYTYQAIRAMNQAIGRVIRHKDDYGAIYLCDARFDMLNLKQHISEWVRRVLVTHANFRDALIATQDFFESCEKMYESTGREVQLQKINLLYELENSLDGRVGTDAYKTANDFYLKPRAKMNYNGEYKNYKRANLPYKKAPPQNSNTERVNLGFNMSSNDIDVMMKKPQTDKEIILEQLQQKANATHCKQYISYGRQGPQKLLYKIKNLPASVQSTVVHYRYYQMEVEPEEYFDDYAVFHSNYTIYKAYQYEEDEDLECGICNKQSSEKNRLFRNKPCSHVACYFCWQKWRETNVSCYFDGCKQLVIEKNLQQIH